MTTETPSDYRPGTCNIGEAQREHRRRLALAMALLAVGYALLVAVSELPTFLLLGTFVPAMLGVEWAIESRRSFCVRLAFAGRYAFGSSTGGIADSQSRRADTRTALRITAVAALLGATITALVYIVVLAL